MVEINHNCTPFCKYLTKNLWEGEGGQKTKKRRKRELRTKPICTASFTKAVIAVVINKCVDTVPMGLKRHHADLQSVD